MHGVGFVLQEGAANQPAAGGATEYDANGRRAWLARSPWYGSTLCAGGAAIEAAYPRTLGLHLPQV